MIEFSDEKFREMFFYLQEEAKKDIKKNSVELEKQWQKIVQSSCKEQEILKKLSFQDAKFLENLKNQRMIHDNLHNSMLYFQGYVDCVKLLKDLGILS